MATTQAYAAAKQTTSLISLMDYIDKPQYWPKFINTFSDQYNLGLMSQMGLMDEVVGGETYYWQENDKIVVVPTVGSIVNNTTYVTITLGPGSYTDSGTKSYGRVGETIELPNYLSGRINAKSTTTPNAHTIDVYPIGLDPVTGSAVTGTQLFTGIVAGMNLPVMTNGFAEGDYGQTTSLISTASRYSNKIQNISDDFTVTFNSQTNETWVNFEFTGPDGGPRNRYYLKNVFDTEMRMMKAIMLACFNGKGGSTTDASGNTVNFTEGLYTTADRYATLLPYGDALNKAYYDQLEKITIRQFAGTTFNQFVGVDANQKLQDLKVDYKKNRPDLVGQEIINMKVSTIEVGNNTYNIIPLAILNDPQSMGSVGIKYPSSILTVPAGTTIVGNDNGTTRESKFFMMRYKPRVRTYKKSYIQFETLGYNGAVATSTQDVKEFHWKAAVGGETHCARQFVLSYKS
jgi:hypothetical protein